MQLPAAVLLTCTSGLSPVVDYHGLGHLYLSRDRLLMRPQLNGGTLGGRPNLRRELESRGFVTVANAVDEAHRARLLALLEPEKLRGATKHTSGAVFAARHLLTTIPELSDELSACGITELAAQFLGPGAFPIDATYFDKQAVANWTVPVHQDRVLPVLLDRDRKHRVARGGVVVAEPSATTLARLLALRIHFDPTDGETGALFVLPGSHVTGVIPSDQLGVTPIAAFVPCVTQPGDVLFMRPLLLHRSSPSRGDGQRRVLHVVYATEQPDDGLRWRASAQQAVEADGRTS